MNENNNLPKDSSSSDGATEIDLFEVFRLLKSKILYIIAAAIAFAVAAYIYFGNFVAPKYTSDARIFIDADYGEMDASLAMTLATNLAKDYPYIIKSRTAMDKVAENLKLEATGEQLISSLEVMMPGEEFIRTLNLTYTCTDPQLAADILNETISVFSERLPELAGYARIKVAVIDPASVPNEPTSPNVKHNTVLGAVIGAVLMSVVFIVINCIDDKLKTQGDVERYLGLNVLASIPEYGDGSSKKGFNRLIKNKAKKSITLKERRIP